MGPEVPVCRPDVATALLGRLPGAEGLTPSALETLRAAARVETFAPGAVLVSEGAATPDWYLVLESGAVEVSRAGPDGREVLGRLGAGDVLDPGAAGVPAAWSATVTEAGRGMLVAQRMVAARRPAVALTGAGPGRGDLALFTRRTGDLVKGPVIACGASTPVAEAARLMSARAAGSVVVLAAAGEMLGIVTDRDVRTRVVARELPHTIPVSQVMSSPVLSIEAGTLAFDALLEMTRRNIHHLAVVEGGRLAGIISSHDLLALQGAHPVALARAIEVEQTLDGLAALAPRVQAVVRWLAGTGVSPFDIGRVVSELNDRLVRQAVRLVEGLLDAQGQGRAPGPYSLVVAGSEGRREQTLKTDQDNGLVYEDPREDAEAAAEYFTRLAGGVTDALARLGFPPCPGGYMASTPRWCRPLSVWRGYFASWMETPQPEPLLQACIFFDLRPVGGDPGPGQRLWDEVREAAPRRTLFLRHMARVASERHPPLGLFGGFVVERSGEHKDALDLKARGVFPMTQAIRVHALALGLPDTNTIDRLRGAGARGIFTPPEMQEFEEAFAVMCRIRLLHQLGCLDAGRPPDNFVNPDTLGKGDRLLLREAFRTMAWLQRGLAERFLTAEIA